MALILENKPIASNVFQMRVAANQQVKAGQFYMLRAWENIPTFSRPISICDQNGEELTFVYEVKGKGTGIFSTLQAGDEIELMGPRGNGFVLKGQKCVLVGGGVGIAPLLLLAKGLREQGAQITAYLGFRSEEYLKEEFACYCHHIITDVGGKITDVIETESFDCAYICGPEVMMQAAWDKLKHSADQIVVSVERRMACGVGVCLGCNIKTRQGNKKVCSDGPIFAAEDVFYE